MKCIKTFYSISNTDSVTNKKTDLTTLIYHQLGKFIKKVNQLGYLLHIYGKNMRF